LENLNIFAYQLETKVQEHSSARESLLNQCLEIFEKIGAKKYIEKVLEKKKLLTT